MTIAVIGQPDPAPEPELEPVGERVTLTAFDRECLQWGQETGSARGLTEDGIAENYLTWQLAVVPQCRCARAQRVCQPSAGTLGVKLSRAIYRAW